MQLTHKTQYGIIFKNGEGEIVKEHICTNLSERDNLLELWVTGEDSPIFPKVNGGMSAVAAERAVPVYEDTRRRSIVTGRYKPSGIDY